MKKVLVKIILVCLMAGMLSACSSQSVKPGVTVRIAYFPNITHAQALVGKADGSFQKAFGSNNKIEWKMFNAGPAEVEAFFAGDVDIGYIGPGPAINGYVKSGGDLQIIAGATDAGAILVSRKGLVIKNLKELDGKKIAVPQFGNTQDLTLRNILLQNGLKDVTKGGTVDIKQVQNPDIKTLMDKGELDAALVPEPWGSTLVKEINANIVLDYNQVWRNGKYSTAVVVVRTKFLKEHSDIVDEFLKTHVDITDYINEHTDEAKAKINSQISELTKSPISKDILDMSFGRLTVTNDPESDSVKEFVTLSVNAGIFKTEPDTKNLFNLEMLNKVLKEKGKSAIN